MESITDKVIKNTFYHFLSQIIGFMLPFLLTPVIISKIGQVEFGIYAIVLGFIGTFGLFDLSISTSFIKFISEYYNKKEFNELNYTINTGLFFYITFSLFICIVVFSLSNTIISFINIPANLIHTGLFSLRISLLIFFIATSTSIFISILISLQKMYINSLIGLIINILNFISIYVLLGFGYGLKGILYSQLAAVIVSAYFNVYLAKRELPEMLFKMKYIKSTSFKKMSFFGLQMQVSRISVFLSEKYDELLLGYFSTLNNVTYFNLAGRVTRLGKFFPLQLFQQVAPVAAELSSKDERFKLIQLFNEATKYLTIFSLPIFIYIFSFAELIMLTWVGEGYTLSVYLIRILVIGQIINMAMSAPGNSIIPNLGVPRFLMYEGIISLCINLILSYLLIKYYGIIGAAIGTTAGTVISSTYIYITSTNFFNEKSIQFLKKNYSKPLIICILVSLLTHTLYILTENNFMKVNNRLTGTIYIFFTGLIFMTSYIWGLYNINYLTERDRDNLSKMIRLITSFKERLNTDRL